MATFLTYVLLRGSRWLRLLFLLLFLAIAGFACVQTYDNFRTALERQVPHHVRDPHTRSARYVQR